jgi:hypothetical protein
MPGVIVPIPSKFASFLIGAVAYKFSRWSITFTLDTGEVLHFDSQVDGAGNVWPTIFSNFARGTFEASGAVDHANNHIPISSGLYIGSTGTGSFLHATTDGFTAPIMINNNTRSSDASSQDPAQQGISGVLTGPPTRVYTL